MAVIEAYFDDGGDSDLAALGGYVGPVSEWAALEVPWNAALLREGLPFYHSVECAQGVEHCAGWPKERRNSLHREMVEIITSGSLMAVGCGVRMDGFREMYAAAKPPGMKPVPKAQFHHCFSVVIQVLAKYMAAIAPNEQVSVVLEETDHLMGRAVDTYEVMMKGRHQHLRRYFAGPPTFRPKLGFPQVQAADVLAYEMALDLKRNFAPSREHPLRGSWVALMKHAANQNGGEPLVQCKTYYRKKGDRLEEGA